MLFNEEEMIKLCQELGIDLIETNNQQPHFHGRILDIDDISAVFSMPVSICELDYRSINNKNQYTINSITSDAA